MKKLLLSALMLMLALPAFAFEIPMPDGMKLNVYGQVRMAAFYQGTNVSNGVVNDTNGDLRYLFQGNSRLGFNLAINNVFANVELSVKPDQTSYPKDANHSPIGFRQFYLGYKFDNGLTFIGGNKTTLSGTNGYFGDVFFGDNGLAGFGTIGDVRRPLLMVSYAGVDFALITNEMDAKGVGGFTKGEYYIPRIEAAYNLNFNNVKGKIFAGYALFTEKDANGSYDNINAFHVGAAVQPTFGPAYVKVSVFYAMNAGMYNAIKMLNDAGNDVSNVLPGLYEGELQDVSTWGVAAAVGYKLNDMVAFELGGGYQDSTSKAFRDAANEEANIAGYAMYLQAPLKFNKYIILTPQVGYYGRSTDAVLGADRKTSTEALLAGAQLKLIF